ncbi:putative RNA methyltransferase Bd2056 [Labeo rohita]|uniref:RNA methyltransferase Bd2056 n=1 Tax=Labeo rohita TaxID=84645 RepID=A0ABQ8MIG5_LABRO|nr:putative RNA methyltransferase Bd2056 [Labeo rohita]
MSVLQAYQADLLKELDEGEEIKKDDITELRRTTDLSLCATKETARSMAALVAAERHLWLTLSVMKEKDRVFLLDAPACSFWPVRRRHQFCRRQVPGGLSWGCWAGVYHPCTSSLYRASQKPLVLPRNGTGTSGAVSWGLPRLSRPESRAAVKEVLNKAAVGRPYQGRAECTAIYGVCLSLVPSGDQPADPAGVPGRHGLQRAHLSAFSTRKRCEAREPATPTGFSRNASLVASCRLSATGHQASSSINTISRLFGSVETTAKCICLGPSHLRVRLSHSIRRRGILFPTLVGPEQGLVMEQEVDTLLRKEAIEVVPPRDRETTQRWSTTSTTREFMSLGISTWEQTSCRGRGQRPGEWMLHPEVVKQIWRVFIQAQVDKPATQETPQCPLWFSLTHPAPLGLDAMVQTWPRLSSFCSWEFWRECTETGSVYS